MGLPTENLMKCLQTESHLDSILSTHQEEFVALSLPDALDKLLSEKGLTRAQVIKNSMLNTIYGYQIFSGTRTPARDKLLCIAFGMNLTLPETDTLLKQQGYSQLYPRNKRDAIIIHCMLNRRSLMDTNTLLYEKELETLI